MGEGQGMDSDKPAKRQKRRADVHTARAVACFGATITPGGQAG